MERWPAAMCHLSTHALRGRLGATGEASGTGAASDAAAFSYTWTLRVVSKKLRLVRGRVGGLHHLGKFLDP